MALVTPQHLSEAGWHPGPRYAELLAAAADYERRGLSDPAYIVKLLERDFGKATAKLRCRERSLPLAEAIESTGPEDEANLGSVRRLMGELLRVPVIEAGAVMPDACPAGFAEATIPVGGAVATRHAILPAAHSSDICCSMHASVFRSGESTAKLLDALVASTRFGIGGRPVEDRVEHPVLHETVWSNPYLSGLEERAASHIADQGDGNHFAYLGRLRATRALVERLADAGHDAIARALRDAGGAALDDPDGCLFHTLVTHHGSRGLGAHVYKRGHQAAVRETRKIADGIPAAAAWLDARTPEGADYWEALQYVARWTKANHEAIHARFLERCGAAPVTAFGNEHNFVWRRGDTFLHGKGATPAWRDEEGRPLLGLIPLNMAEPVLLTLGSDQEDFLGFAPHGAGRNRSRTATLRAFRKAKGDSDEQTVAKAVAEATRGLDIRWYCGRPDLTESPVGYKPAAQVRAQIERFGLAETLAEIEPLGCVMAGDPGPRRRPEILTPKQKRQLEHRAERRKDRQGLRGKLRGEFGDDEG